MRVIRIGVRVVLLATLVTVAIGFFLGYRVEAVMSGSMHPTLGVGDLVVSQPVEVDDIRRGDIVTFSYGKDHRSTTHRVESVQRVTTRSGSRLKVVTKGDANRTTERWEASPDGTVGRTVAHVPYLGRALMFVKDSWFRPVVVSVVTLILFTWLMTRLWRPDEARGVTDSR